MGHTHEHFLAFDSTVIAPNGHLELNENYSKMRSRPAQKPPTWRTQPWKGSLNANCCWYKGSRVRLAVDVFALARHFFPFTKYTLTYGAETIKSFKTAAFAFNLTRLYLAALWNRVAPVILALLWLQLPGNLFGSTAIVGCRPEKVRRELVGRLAVRARDRRWNRRVARFPRRAAATATICESRRDERSRNETGRMWVGRSKKCCPQQTCQTNVRKVNSAWGKHTEVHRER